MMDDSKESPKNSEGKNANNKRKYRKFAVDTEGIAHFIEKGMFKEQDSGVFSGEFCKKFATVNSTVTGATIGTYFSPMIGTVIGGMVGGLADSAVGYFSKTNTKYKCKHCGNEYEYGEIGRSKDYCEKCRNLIFTL